jgi:hypothetical protein
MYLIDKVKFDSPKENVKKAWLMFVEDNKICDGCDERKPCASVKTLSDVMIICEDCVTGILNHFNPNLAKLIREDRIESLLKEKE